MRILLTAILLYLSAATYNIAIADITYSRIETYCLDTGKGIYGSLTNCIEDQSSAEKEIDGYIKNNTDSLLDIATCSHYVVGGRGLGSSENIDNRLRANCLKSEVRKEIYSECFLEATGRIYKDGDVTSDRKIADTIARCFNKRISPEHPTNTQAIKGKIDAVTKLKPSDSELKVDRSSAAPIEDGAIISSSDKGWALSLINPGVGIVRAHGWKCDSVSAVQPMPTTKGFILRCNNFSYVYVIEDKGGQWTATLK